MESKKILIKHFIRILMMIVFFAHGAKGQNASEKKYDYAYEEIDSTLLMNKAKLLCISKSGVDDIDSIYRNAMTQKSEIFHTENKFYDVIMVKSNQFLSNQVKTKKKRLTLYCGEDFKDSSPCFYTLVFSYYTSRFYLITGFAWSDIKELDEEMSKHYMSVYNIFSEELVKKLSINFDCLVSKYIDKEAKNQDKQCYRECGKCMEMAEVH